MKKKAAKPIKDPEIVKDIQDYLKDKNERDYILFVLGIGTGYRAGDLVKLKIRDVKQALEDGYFEIYEEKKINNKRVRKENLKPRIAYIPVNLERILRKYIKGKKDWEYMFKSRKGKGHITVSHVGRILREVGKEFGLKNISSHSMRKTYAYTIYLKNDYNIYAVKEMLNHSDVNITKRYIGLDMDTYEEYSKSLNSIIRV